MQLPSASAKLADALALMSSRVGRPLLQQIKYVDSDGTVITVSAEEEWKALLASGIQALEGAEAGTEPAEVDWELAAVRPHSAPVRAGPAWSQRVRFWVNGEEVVVENPSPTSGSWTGRAR